jgi:hypothetical protein
MNELDQYTVSLLHFDGGIKDESGKVWTAQNGAAVNSALSKFGGSALSLNGINQYLTTPATSDFNFGTGDFTIDWWEYRTNTTANACVYNGYYTNNVNNTAASGIVAGMCYDGFIRTVTGDNTITYTVSATMGIPILNAWTHYAFVRKGTTYYAFQNGVMQSSGTFSGSVPNCTAPTIGTALSNLGQVYFPGYVDEFRISKGIARWTEDFNPEKPVSSNKALLVVTMYDEIQKEYELSMDEINDFIKWYDNRATGTGLPHYTFNKDFNLGPFLSRKDYLVFDKIQNFEVLEYTE